MADTNTRDKLLFSHWHKRFEALQTSLKRNNFKVFLAQDIEEVKKVFFKEIIPEVRPNSISWGGSMTFVSTGLYHELKDNIEYTILDTFDKKLSPEEMVERRRQALLVDLFITSTNAITEKGQLVNLDMIGNRIGGLTFGPKHVVVLVGRNKIVKDLHTAMERIRHYASPLNIKRLEKKSPCSKTSFCEDCSSVDRICNTWAITEKCFPANRIKVILINSDLGL